LGEKKGASIGGGRYRKKARNGAIWDYYPSETGLEKKMISSVSFEHWEGGKCRMGFYLGAEGG